MPPVENVKHSLNPFENTQVDIMIQDKDGPKTPSIQKRIKRVEINREQTHILLYFDQINHISVPLTCIFSEKNDVWEAFDSQTGLYYIIRRVDENK